MQLSACTVFFAWWEDWFYWNTFWSNKSYLDVKLDYRLTMKMMTVMVNTQTMGQRRLLWRATRLHWMRKPVLWMSTWSSKLSYKVSIYIYIKGSQMLVCVKSFIILLLTWFCCISDLQANDPNWYNSLISQLTEEQRKEVEEVFKLAEQRRAAAGQCHCACTCVR